jgi:protein TonB
MSVSLESKREVPLLAVFTFVLWTVTCSVAAVGVLIPYVRPTAAEKKEMVINAEMLQVELTSEPIATVPEELASTAQPEPPELEPVTRPIETPSFTAVADPRVVAFAVPVEGPVRLVEVKAAAFAAPAEPVKTNATAQFATPPQQLIYGQGEGRQPAPDYPYRAKREGQEGIVNVRFSVGEDGRVLSAEAASPSPWPLLNDAALRAVRERWRFRAGTVRSYEVAIRFQLR